MTQPTRAAKKLFEENKVCFYSDSHPHQGHQGVTSFDITDCPKRWATVKSKDNTTNGRTTLVIMVTQHVFSGAKTAEHQRKRWKDLVQYTELIDTLIYPLGTQKLEHTALPVMTINTDWDVWKDQRRTNTPRLTAAWKEQFHQKMSNRHRGGRRCIQLRGCIEVNDGV